MKTCLILTGNEVHHNFFANSLINELKEFKFDIFKTSSFKNDFEFFYPTFSKNVTKRNKAKLIDFLFNRNKKLCLEEDFQLLKSPISQKIFPNSNELHSFLDKFLSNESYDLVVTYGSPIITNNKLLNMKSFNIHFGLSRFYRGGTSNITALAAGEFEKVGVTCHELKKTIDDGRVLFEINNPPLKDYKNIDEMNYYLLKATIYKFIEICKKGTYDVYEIAKGVLIPNNRLTHDILLNAEKNLTKLRETKNK